MVQSEKSTGCVPASSPTYDVAGNLTYDGLQCYTYDAWNRLATVTHGYRDATGVHSGGMLSTCGYDGRGRRISKAITGTGSLDCTYQYYYDQDSLAETRNGSDIAIKQQVWGLQYVDELVQVAVNSDQSTDNSCDALSWVCQDANYNVLGLVDNQGVLAERYEYTPYGQRAVFFSPGVNDVGCYASTLTSRKIVVGGVAQPYGLCEFGHQGLQHDEESGLIYNRTRMVQPVLGRFMQRDPLGYIDGMSVFEYQRGCPVFGSDPLGDELVFPTRSAIHHGQCGGFSATINWNVVLMGPPDPKHPGRSGAAGWIVQEITDVIHTFNADGTVNQAGTTSKHYWEAWPVQKDSSVAGGIMSQVQVVSSWMPGRAEGAAKSMSFQNVDEFGIDSKGIGTKGDESFSGVAAFFPGYTLPASFTTPHPNGFEDPIWARDLPATQTDPGILTNAPVVHVLQAKWDCSCGARPTVFTVEYP